MRSIYDAVGGQAALEAAVERFYERLTADPLLASFFAGMDMRKLKVHQLAFLGQAIGGPMRYNGASMQRAHAHLRIEQRHFDAVADHLRMTLEEFSVPYDLTSAIMERIGGLASQIVNTPSTMPLAPDWQGNLAASLA
jgi:hemoglobin